MPKDLITVSHTSGFQCSTYQPQTPIFLQIHGFRDVYKFLESKDDLKMRVVRQHRAFTVVVKPESDLD